MWPVFAVYPPDTTHLKKSKFYLLCSQPRPNRVLHIGLLSSRRAITDHYILQLGNMQLAFVTCGALNYTSTKNTPVFSGQSSSSQCSRRQRRHQVRMNVGSQNRPQWSCMQHCGACCKLDDFDPDVLRQMLSKEQDVVEYLSMIRPDGWCTHFDSFSRKCTIYDSRPYFCRATPQVFQQLYNVPPSQFDQFATSCCEFHIANTYGKESNEAFRYDSFK